ncbi:hypothetical protein DEA06_06785 [Microbacterium sp. Gd 4-13]|uniref:hypothetical protein n=1 Tax=Microbacterium sp. Gd 4-13 TaxID=2173179 RepID=UPI000D573459|nr:hypothetical protein [Microbacterium sp. Gd 4-13]PVW05439.1 hypothetical protein DEA06_06785 [Microbacterium sp. Gd 4-13]
MKPTHANTGVSTGWVKLVVQIEQASVRRYPLAADLNADEITEAVVEPLGDLVALPTCRRRVVIEALVTIGDYSLGPGNRRNMPEADTAGTLTILRHG